MASYLSKFRGKEIDDSIDLFDDKGLEAVGGPIEEGGSGKDEFVMRTHDGYFRAAVNEPAEKDSELLTVVSAGEKYQWNRVFADAPDTLVGAANGLVPLDENVLIPSRYLPSFVDDVLEGYAGYKVNDKIEHFYNDANRSQIITDNTGVPADRQSSKIYYDFATNNIYRWSGEGSGYIMIPESLALGSTENTAFNGAQGMVAYNHAIAKGNQYSQKFYKIGTNAEGHVTSVTEVGWDDLKRLGAIKGGHNSKSAVTITPTTTSVWSITDVGRSNVPTKLDTSKFSGGGITITQDANDETHFTIAFSQAQFQNGFYTEGTASTTPTRAQVSSLWNGYTSGVNNTYADAQTFTIEQ